MGGSSYRQWLKLGEVLGSSQTLVILDENPDSINDGSFVNHPDSPSSWVDIPAAHHNGGCSLSFADGRSEVHKWLSNATKLPVQFSYDNRPAFDALGRRDYDWPMSRAFVLY